MMSLSVFDGPRRPSSARSAGTADRPGTRTSGAFTCFLSTRAVCGICASRTASAASSVPGTEASTRDRSCESGIFLKSSGRFGVANVHGPSKAGAVNQRPETRKYTGPFLPSLKTSLSVLLTQSSLVPVTEQIVRRAAQQNQLRRRRADEHLRHRCRRQRAAGQRRLHVLPVVVGRQLREGVRQLARRLPRSLDVGGASASSGRSGGRTSWSGRARTDPSWC